MDGVLETLVLAFIIGLTGALAPGPTLVATIQASVRGGWTVGPKVTLGHIAIETLVFLLILFGFSAAALTYSHPVALLGGSALIGFGILTVKESMHAHLDRQSPSAFSNPYLAGVITAITNPYFWIWWLTVGSTLVIEALESGILLAVIFMVGHWSADAGWLTAVSTGIHRGRTILSENGYQRVLLLCGAFLIFFGSYYLITAIAGMMA
ncbi:MAG: LysE family translocator [Methanomicrobiales archaeon]|nr:LysE family translocator [Methanomicrobiales archaeon]